MLEKYCATCGVFEETEYDGDCDICKVCHSVCETDSEALQAGWKEYLERDMEIY